MKAAPELLEKVSSLESELDLKNKQIKSQKTQIKVLEEQLRLSRQKQFGASSEQASPQQNLFNEAEEAIEEEQLEEHTASVEVPAHTRKKKKRISIPEHIEREDIIHDLPDAEKVCPHDGTALKCIGEESHEQLDIIPAKIKALRHIRKKYACPCCEQYLVTAKKPKQPIEKSIASPGLLAHVAVSKYADALPLYRQTAMFKRIGVELDRTSLANWMIKCGQLIQPLFNRLQDHLLEQTLIHMDETTLQVLHEPGKKAQSKSYMWCMAADVKGASVVLYHYSDSRSQATPNTLLSGYRGGLMVDGYNGYQPACDTENITRLGCWAHARRKFVDAQKAQTTKKAGKADYALAGIQKLYRIEKEAKAFTPEERYQLRQEKAKPIIEKLRQWLEKSLTQVPPKTLIGKALTYLLNQWRHLVRYLENGLYPIDNNRAENTIRPFVVGRKNWLFANSQAGANASANLYSLIETAKAQNLEPYSYLKDVFTRLPNALTVEDIDALLPWVLREKEK
jgi:transposase